MPVPLIPRIAGAIGEMIGGKEGIEKAAGAVFQAQVIGSGVKQLAGLVKQLGTAILDLPLAPVKALDLAAKAAQLPVMAFEHTVTTFASAIGESSKAVQMPLAAVSIAMDGFSSVLGSIQAPFMGVVTSLKTMRDSIGALGATVSEFVRLANPVEVQKFNLAMDDMTAVFGKVLTPVLKASTALVRGFADVFFGMSNAFTRAAEKLFDPFTKAIPKIVNAFGPLVDGISDFVDMAIDALAPFVDVGVKVFTELSAMFSKTATQLLDPIMRVMPRVVNVFKLIADSISRAFDAVTAVLGPLIEAFMSMAGSLADVPINALVGSLEMAASGAMLLASSLETMARGFISIFKVIGEGMIKLANIGGIKLPGMGGPARESRPLADRSVGAAVRPATIGSVEDYGRKAQQAAFSLGAAADRPEIRTAKASEDLLTYVRGGFWADLKKSLGDAIPDLPEMPKTVEGAKTIINDAGRGLEERAERSYNVAKSWIAKQF